MKKRTLVLRRKVTPKSICTPQLPEDCVALAVQIQYGGKGFTKDPVKAASYYRIACDADDTGGCTNLADMLDSGGGGVAKDEAEARRLLRHACDLGDCMSLGFALIESDDTKERDEGRALFARICDDKEIEEGERASACFMRADRAATRADGAPWHVKACEAGHERGCEQLAQLYFNDEYPGATPAKSTRALEAMCNRSFAMACSFVAQRHFEGKGAPASRAEADRWMEKACNAGDDSMCRALERRR